jgi:DNA-binding transcriptional regulator YbjK
MTEATTDVRPTGSTRGSVVGVVKILAAATTLMQQSGFHARSMQSVADRAHVGVGLIDQYFGELGRPPSARGRGHP